MEKKPRVIILLRENTYENKMKIIIIHYSKRVFSLSIRLAGGEVDARWEGSRRKMESSIFFLFSFASLTDLCDGIFSMQYNNAQGRFSMDIKKNANLSSFYLFFLFLSCLSEIKFKSKKEHIVHNETERLLGE